MEKSTIAVFTSPTCPFCPAAKKVAQEVASERDDVVVKEFNSGTPEGRQESMKFGIQSVPTIHVRGPKHHEVLGFVGAPSKSRLQHAVDVTQGKAEMMPEPSGLFGKLKNAFSS